MTQKIIICGFPHCGTTILKSIIGHIDEVEEIHNETNKINIETDKKYILCKSPITENIFFEDAYKDYIKIFIIRNPLFVFSSIKIKTFRNSIIKYIKTIKMFINFRNNPRKDVYTIRYEDLFENNYENLKSILNDIGFNYNDDIFNNTKYKNIFFSGVRISEKRPSYLNHAFYRTWQINQPFVSFNNVSNIRIKESLKQYILNDEDISQVYPDLKTLV